MATVYSIKLLPSGSTRDVLFGLARSTLDAYQRRFGVCLVLGPSEAYYLERDGTCSGPAEPPSGGIIVDVPPSLPHSSQGQQGEPTGLPLKAVLEQLRPAPGAGGEQEPLLAGIEWGCEAQQIRSAYPRGSQLVEAIPGLLQDTSPSVRGRPCTVTFDTTGGSLRAVMVSFTFEGIDGRDALLEHHTGVLTTLLRDYGRPALASPWNGDSFQYLWLRGPTLIHYAWNGASHWGLHYRSLSLDPTARLLHSRVDAERQGEALPDRAPEAPTLPDERLVDPISEGDAARSAKALAAARWPAVDVEAVWKLVGRMYGDLCSSAGSMDNIECELRDEASAECLEFLLTQGLEHVPAPLGVIGRVARIGTRIILDFDVSEEER